MTAPVPQLLRDVGARVEAILLGALDAERARWASIDPVLAEPFTAIGDMVGSGGKRLRPALCHIAFVGCGGDPDDSRHMEVGAAIEMLHVCALIHDDITDGARTRRGAPSLHARFERDHAGAGWAGETRRFGEGAALLVGDLAFALSDVLLGDVGAPVRGVWNELRLEVNAGQYLDVVGSARGERGREATERICRLKSGKYTVERPLHLGALQASVTVGSEMLPVLSAYGLPLGDAFQMRDDVLGAFGDASVTGKPVGADLVEGKPTPLLARAMERADAAQREVLGMVGSPAMDAGSVAAVQEVIVATGALDELESRIGSLRDEAIGAVRASRLPASTIEDLVGVADFVTARRT